MDATISLTATGGNRTYGLSSLDSGRAIRSAREATPDKPETLTVSHSNSKNGRRRSLVKVEKTTVDTLGISRKMSTSFILDRHVGTAVEVDIDHITDLLTNFFADESRRDMFNNSEV